MKLYKADKVLFVWVILVFAAIAWPSPSIPEIDKIEYSDKIAHAILFGGVTFLASGSLAARGMRQRTIVLISLLGGAAYAGLAEIIQIFIPGRSCSLYDFYAGAIGSMIALAIICFWKSMHKVEL